MNRLQLNTRRRGGRRFYNNEKRSIVMFFSVLFEVEDVVSLLFSMAKRQCAPSFGYFVFELCQQQRRLRRFPSYSGKISCFT